jgi:two-component system sensor histidine kinase HydH
MLKRILLPVGIGLSLVLIWFAIANYRASLPIAEETLQGLSLSFATVVENIAVRDPSFRSLSEFRSPDIAYLAIIDKQGIYRFHSNPGLVGKPATGDEYKKVFAGKTVSGTRRTLGTGEKAYEVFVPLYLARETVVLRLALHSYLADTVVRRAEFNMAVVLALLMAGWFLGAFLYRYAVREERHKFEMARRERLAQMGEMGAMLAHEIRNPLAGIKGYAQIIGKRPAEERNAGFAQRIVAEVLRLESLVSDLLAYAGNESYPMASVDLRELIGNTALLIRQEADLQHVTIGIECGGGIQAFGNRDRLGQVLLNLAKNAVQAMPEGGCLFISACVSGKDVIIRVRDSGEGISAENLPRIFDPFFTTKARGTGIGLALCKKIIEEHKGAMTVESTRGTGTSVSVTLPNAQPKKKRGR